MKKLLIVFSICAAVASCNSGDDKQTTATDEQAADTPSAPSTSLSAANEKGLELIGASDCTTCHGIDKKIIGPAYTEVANKYETSDIVMDTLVSKIINGGAGNWGTVAMTPHPTLPKEDAREMVKYIMSLKTN